MIRLIWSGVRFARGRAVALAAGMLVAATAFSLLTASVDVGTARIKGIVGRNWRGAYDLLVLPAGSGKAPGTGRLVQDNYLSTASGGITAAQYRRIAHLPGVGVAAPLAILGYVLETAFIGVDVSSVAGRTGARVLTVTSRFTADHGLSKYPPRQEGYVYITPDPLTPLQLGRQIGPVERLPDGRNVTVCPIAAGQAAVGQSSPFQLDAGLLSGSCYSRTSQAPATVQGTVAWSFPVLVAAIDPQAENQLTGLGRAVTSGRYLGQGEGDTGTDGTTVPVLASTVSFDGDDDQVTVSLLPPSAVGVVRSDLGPAHIAGALGTEKASPVMRLTITGAQAWQQLLNQLAAPAVTAPGTHAVGVSLSRTLGQYWTSGQVADHREIGGQRDPVPVANPDSVWLAGIGVNGRDYVFAPPAAADTGFRTLTEHIELSGQGTGETVLQTVGQFDPNRLAGFSGGPGSPLASYRAPLLTGANAASRALLGGRPLEPSGNMAGYAQPPPLLLTTLAGLRTLENPERYSGTSGQATAPIGSIRVRVAGLHGTVRQQLAKIAAVGQEISKATGLRVDVTAGSSQQQVAVGLASGKFGRPMLQLSEPWTATSVSLVILRQADRESLALFVLILAVCGLFLAAATLA